MNVMRTLVILLAGLLACERSSDPTAPYVACPGGSVACEAPCLALDGASVCGPACRVAGRCDDDSLAGVCDLRDGTPNEPGLCVLTCSSADDCPTAGMVCLQCPHGVDIHTCAIGRGIGLGEGICAWPDERP